MMGFPGLHIAFQHSEDESDELIGCALSALLCLLFAALPTFPRASFDRQSPAMITRKSTHGFSAATTIVHITMVIGMARLVSERFVRVSTCLVRTTLPSPLAHKLGIPLDTHAHFVSTLLAPWTSLSYWSLYPITRVQARLSSGRTG